MDFYTMLMKEGRKGDCNFNQIKSFVEKTNHVGIGIEEYTLGSGIFSDIQIGSIIVLRIENMVGLLETVGTAHKNKNQINYNNKDFDWLENYIPVNVLDWKKNEMDFRGSLQTFSTLPAKHISIVKEWYFEKKKEQDMKTYINLLESNKNLILTGAPGTGKTYLAKEIAKKMILTTDVENQIELKAFNEIIFLEKDREDLNFANISWSYWKNRILSDDFNLDDYANTLNNIEDETIKKYGGYIPCFLEFRSSIYGGARSGDARRYGIKKNKQLETYSISGNDQSINRQQAEKYFNQNIKIWLQEFIKSDLNGQNNLIESENIPIKSKQLLRKILILEHPIDLLSIYDDYVLNNAYNFFIFNGQDNSWISKNIELINNLYNRFNLEKNNENSRKLSWFIWNYFSNNPSGDYNDILNGFKEKYLDNYLAFVQFHPSFDYTDFVEGLRPIKGNENKEIGFKLKDGIFMEFCKNAKEAYIEDKGKNEEEKRKYVFIIDEINRGEISKIFGELFFSIDPGYRGEKGKVQTQYANLRPKNERDFYVPENVYIIGTMNDIDRSVESFDFAMRRRFAWVEITPEERINMLDMLNDEKVENDKDIKIEKAKEKMKSLNKAIFDEKTKKGIDGLNSSYQIGPAYFLKLSYYRNESNPFVKLWENHIEILLKEYLRGIPDADKSLETLKNAYDLIGQGNQND